MGVPSLFAWWVEHYLKSILFGKLPTKGRKVLYFDFNGLIHPAVRADELELSQMLTSVTDYLMKVCNAVKMDEIYIAIDGVAPAAKLRQQQDRRYKSAKEAKVMRDISVKHGQPVRSDDVDFNMISPGTKFMMDLQIHLDSFITQKCLPGGVWQNIKVSLNGANNPGEGEHKIMEEIRSRKHLGLNEQILIYGLDADLIFLTLINAPHAYLVRENIQFKNREKTDFLDVEKFPFLYLDISSLKKIIINTINPRTHIDKLIAMGFKNDIIDANDIDTLCMNYEWFHDNEAEHQRLLIDYAYICFFLGNDFLPHLPSLKISNGSLNELLIIYKKVSWMVKGFLVTPDGKNVNSRFLTEFLAELAFIEDDLMQQLSEKRYRDIKYFMHKQKSLPVMQAEIDRFRYIEDRYDDQVRGGTPGWNTRYYLHYHKLHYRHPKDFTKNVDKMCAEYLKGTLWVLNYYQGHAFSWSWLYPYFAAPTAADLANYQPRSGQMNAPEVGDSAVTPFVQLMSVLPPDSSRLVPLCLGHYMTSRNSPVHYMYPVNITMQLLGHKWYHECKAQLPYINRDILTDLVKQHEADFTDEEKERNKLMNVLIEWNY